MNRADDTASGDRPLLSMAVAASSALAPHESPSAEIAGELLATDVYSGRTAQRDALYRWSLAAADVVAVLVAMLVLATLLGNHLTPVWLLALPIIVLASKVTGLYDRDELLVNKSTLDETPALFRLATLYALSLWLFEDFLLRDGLGKLHVGVQWVVLFASLILLRKGARELASQLAGPERLLLIRDGAIADSIQGKLESNRMGARVVGCVEIDSLSIEGGARDRNGDREASLVGALRECAARLEADRAIITPGDIAHEITLDLIRAAKEVGLKVSVMPRVLEVIGSSVAFDYLDGIPFLGVCRFGLTRSSRLVKRSFDLVAASLGLVVLTPVLLALALAVRLDSQGPALFRQRRIGHRGLPFGMLKFRTMVNGADAQKDELRHLNEVEGLFKIAADPRITRVGRFLRRTSLDELPQLWNVVRGEMSLVGPRPLVDEDDQRVTGWQRQRLNLTPGMTGQWQILGSGQIPLSDMVAIDYLYASHWSLWSDVKILARTLPYVIGQRGL